ncbi:MAG: peptide deformylase [Patescibacteria group bacterium]|nr:peptide deformylase [Patescibacteria group bacterium]
MTFTLKKYPDPILRKKAEAIKEINEEIKKIAQLMIEVKENSQGLGLAGPQIGILKRIIAVTTEKGPQIFLNPEILAKSKRQEIMEEGCLSFPGLYLKIKRPIEVEIKALNLNGRELKFKVQGLTARIFQHEIDHLNGVLFIDRLPWWQRAKLKIKRLRD